jgi:hypothetical protein
MDLLTFEGLLRSVGNIGISGVILVLWYFSMKAQEKTMARYRSDTSEMFNDYKTVALEMKRMYENNVVLANKFCEMTRDHKEVIVMVTQVLTHLSDDIRTNQYCPLARINKNLHGGCE